MNLALIISNLKLETPTHKKTTFLDSNLAVVVFYFLPQEEVEVASGH
jgi:hypothetical protein